MDLGFVRSCFPALCGEWVYLDNAGGSQVLGEVAARVSRYLLETNVQHGASYAPSLQAVEAVAAGVAAVTELFGASDPSEVLLGPSTTQLLANVARAMVAGRWIGPGDEVVVSTVDHEANRGPWRRLAEHGVVVRDWAPDPESLRLEPAGLLPLLGPRTRLVACTHCSNVLGSFHDVAAFARLAHAHGARLAVDGVALAPHRRIDVGALGVDLYAFSLYKVFGPHLAALWGRRELLAALGTINHDFIADDDVPYKLQPGGPCYELAAALPAIPDYLEAVGRRAGATSRADALALAFDAFAAHEEQLAERLLAFLRERPGVRIVGESTAARTHRAPTVSFVVAGRDSASIVAAIDRAKIGIRYGHFYAKRLIDDLGLAPQQGVVRVSLVHYNTAEEIDRLLTALDQTI